MHNPNDLNLIERFNQRFGEIAVRRGFISSDQVREALEEQMSNEPYIRLRPHRVIGLILLEKGWMTFEQVIAVLEELFPITINQNKRGY